MARPRQQPRVPTGKGPGGRRLRAGRGGQAFPPRPRKGGSVCAEWNLLPPFDPLDSPASEPLASPRAWPVDESRKFSPSQSVPYIQERALVDEEAGGRRGRDNP